jgi:hypothetical protein
MKTVRDACQLQNNALSIKLSDQIEQLDELITAEGNARFDLPRNPARFEQRLGRVKRFGQARHTVSGFTLLHKKTKSVFEAFLSSSRRAALQH